MSTLSEAMSISQPRPLTLSDLQPILTTFSPRIFWFAMSIAIIVLLGLVARLLRSETGQESGV